MLPKDVIKQNNNNKRIRKVVIALESEKGILKEVKSRFPFVCDKYYETFQ